MKRQILKLRNQGKTYSQIQQILKCSKATISYHCGKGRKEKQHIYRNRLKKLYMLRLKTNAGGKCSKCSYDKCFAALDFHHNNPLEKENLVYQVLINNGYEAAKKEASKCILLCSNCHRELHHPNQDWNLDEIKFVK